MHTGFAVFVVIGSLIVAAIYSSSTCFVFATITACAGVDKKTQMCTVNDEEGGSTTWKCTKNKDGKTWHCDEVKTITNPPAGLTDAVVQAQASSTTGGNNNTSFLDSNLKDRVLKGAETADSNGESANDTSQ